MNYDFEERTEKFGEHIIIFVVLAKNDIYG